MMSFSIIYIYFGIMTSLLFKNEPHLTFSVSLSLSFSWLDEFDVCVLCFDHSDSLNP